MGDHATGENAETRRNAFLQNVRRRVSVRRSVLTRVVRVVRRRGIHRVPILQAVNQRLGIRAGGLRGFTGLMLPSHLSVAAFIQRAADDFDERVKRHLVTLPQIQRAPAGVRRRRRIVKQRPTAIKHRSTHVFRHVQGRDVRRTQGHHHEHELQVGKFGVIDVERLHGRFMNG